MSRSRFVICILLFTLAGLLLAACGPTPAVTQAQAEQELGSFVLDFVIREQIGGTAEYIETSGQPWVDAPPDANIIVWAPPVDRFDENAPQYLNTDAPLHVWWLDRSQLTEVGGDKVAAIASYRATHMQDPESNVWAWGYYEYGILSLENGNRKAKVYVGISCGPLCGTGTIYTLARDASGKWAITDSEMKWIS